MEQISEYLQFPGYLTEATAMAAVALLGYLFGRRSIRRPDAEPNEELINDINRAVRIARDLQCLTDQIRQELAKHQTSIARFRSHVGSINSSKETEGWAALAAEAEALLIPTMTVTTSLSAAYDQLRKHSAELMNFAGSRTDPETGVGNRRALEQQLNNELVAYELNRNRFCLAMFSVSGLPGQQLDDEQMKKMRASFARLAEHTARDADFVARYSEDEFAVVLPQTSLAGATVFSERLLRMVEVSVESVVSGGIAEVNAEDDTEKLFSRVDSALYSARTSGGGCLYLHDGKSLRRLQAPKLEESAEEEATVQEETAPVK